MHFFRYLEKHPEYIDAGVNMSQFSFQIPRPLQENYVRKRPARSMMLNENNGFGMQRFSEPSEGKNATGNSLNLQLHAYDKGSFCTGKLVSLNLSLKMRTLAGTICNVLPRLYL